MNDYKQLSYGVTDFDILRHDNLYYVDKTKYIDLIEQTARFLFISRPRRFGKSLFLSMLEAYYDINKKDQFDTLFGDLYIGQHPTPIHNKYLVLRLDFSQIGGRLESLEEDFDSYVGSRLERFVIKYKDFFGEDVCRKCSEIKSFRGRLNLIFAAASQLSLHLYLFLDEYDNFMNTLLHVGGLDIFKAITHGNGFYRDVFKLFKGNFERIFMLGVNPMTLDDLTSGFNIATNITMASEFNQMLGFSEDEVRQMIRYYQQAGKIPQGPDQEESMIEEMKPWYDNYCFSKGAFGKDPKMFNSDMALYYINNWLRYGMSPEDMLDVNTRTDYAKLQNLVDLDHIDGLGNYREGVISKIIDEGKIYATLVPQFSVEKITEVEMFPSLLYYYGMLTITGIRGGFVELSIPNNNVRKQFYEYLIERCKRIDVAERLFLPLGVLLNNMALVGEYKPALLHVADMYDKVSSVRNAIEGERNIQGFFMAMFCLTTCYKLCPEMEFAHGYCDFFLLPDIMRYPDVAHSYVIELKYHAKGTYTANADAKREEAKAQLERYASDDRLRVMLHGTTLHTIIMQFEAYQLMEIVEI